MVQVSRRGFLPYVVAVGSVLLAFGVVKAIGPAVLGLSPLFFAAVMLTAWLGGMGPGMVATALAGTLSAVFFIEPMHGRVVDWDDIVRVAAFIGVSTLTSSLNAAAKRSQAQLQQANDKLAAANQAKDHFLAVLSHELRNPLTPVLMAASIMERNAELPTAVTDDAAMIRRNVELEVRLIDDLLDITRITRGKLALHLEHVDVIPLVDDVAKMCAGELADKDLRLIIHRDAQLRFVNADSTRLRQVLWNLLRNAIKFTPVGGVITITCSDVPGGLLQFELADTGVGIAADVLPRIFQPFEQGEQNTNRQFGGLGLGLAISKALVEAHGGSIHAHSEGKGKGAVFTIHLPAMKGATAPTGARQIAPPPAGPHRLRILLVEDHEDTARLLLRVLRRSDHEVRAAMSIATALESAREHHFDLVISDLGLPDGSGLELMRQLRHHYGLRGIALSGYATEQDIRNVQDAGFEHHLAKPLDLGELESAIKNVADNLATASD